jgi:hypothetical protein
MSPAGLNVLERTSVVRKFKCPLKKTQPSCSGSRDLNWTGKGLRWYKKEPLWFRFNIRNAPEVTCFNKASVSISDPVILEY